jgi:hypothetical protein
MFQREVARDASALGEADEVRILLLRKIQERGAGQG